MSEQDLQTEKQKLRHRAARYFEDVACYHLQDILDLFGWNQSLNSEKDPEKLKMLLEEGRRKMDGLKKREDAPEKIMLWEKQTMPSLGNYTENPELRFNHDPDYEPYMYAITVPEDVTPKGAVVVCAGADHGDCTVHEGYQSCLSLRDLGYQTFLLLNRTNNCPYQGKEAGADAARAIRYVRRNAARYRMDENRVAFAGFSNGGLTGEACIQYYSGTQQVKTHFPEYVPDELDAFYGAPDAFLCVYGPRFKNAEFDYTNVVYPPVFFAVGREDFAMQNLSATVPDLLEHQVEVEIHTFAGVPHGQSGVQIYGNNNYPNFQLWPMLADSFLLNVFSKSVVKRHPEEIPDKRYRFDAFSDGKVFAGKKKRLPAMGWNSWNAFGTGNTEALTKAMAEKLVELGLDRCGYRYVVLDDGCYKNVRVDGKLAPSEKFPSGFTAMSDFLHERGLKFGMYNDIGSNLCSGLAVGTCGHEQTDAQSYTDWKIDYLKVDNCYYLWDNATFSKAENARYVYAPNVRKIRISGNEMNEEKSAVADGVLRGQGAEKKEDYVTGIGTFDGTGPFCTPVGNLSGELVFRVNVPCDGEYGLFIEYSTGMKEGCGSWMEVAVGEGENSEVFYDDFLPSSGKEGNFIESPAIRLNLTKGENAIRLMNHRRQENTLLSYATMKQALEDANPDNDILLSICEWGKTQPQNWGYKVGDSWRILNDITFRVGSDGDPGNGTWKDDYTPSVTSQYNKAVIMDEFSGPDKGYNDPDMLMIGMNGLTETMQRTHMAMWCMLNAPLMLGLDLRRVSKGDFIWNLISNEKLIALNQDALGIQAKRVAAYLFEDGTTVCEATPDKTYIRDINRVDVLAKPLADGSVAVSFINVSEKEQNGNFEISAETIADMLGEKMASDAFAKAQSFRVENLFTDEVTTVNGRIFNASHLDACDNVTLKVTPNV